MSTRDHTLLTGSATYLVANVVSAAVPFLLIPILTRLLSTSEYGQVAMFQVVLAALSSVVGLNVHGAANRKFFDHDPGGSDLRALVGACFYILLGTTAIASLALALAGGRLAPWLGLDVSWLLVAPVVAASSFVVLIRLGQWQVRKQAVRYGVLQVAQAVLGFGLTLLLVAGLGMGADGRMAAMTLVPVVAGVAAALLLWRDGLVGLRWRPDLAREALRYGVPLVPHAASFFLLGMADRAVVNAQLGLDQAGIYMVAAQLAMGLSVVFDAINKAYVPWLFERLTAGDPAVNRRIVRATYRYFALLALAAVAGFWLAPPVVVLVAGDAYRQAGDIVGWLVLGQIFGGMYLMVTNYIFYSKRTGLLSAVSISSGALNLVLLVVLVREMGLSGAAVAFAISMAVRFVLTWAVAQKRHPMPWFSS